MWRWILALWVMLMAGCSPQSPHALKVATNSWLGYEPLYLARYIDAYERNVDIVQLPSATDVMRALRNGNVDVAATTLDEALLLASQGEDLVVLMALDFSQGADVVLGRPPIASLRDIKGKRVGVENTGLGALVLSAALDMGGLSFADIRPVNLTIDQHLTAYAKGEIDVVVTFEPVATQLRNQGANPLFDSSAVPDLVVDVLVARRAALQNQNAAVVDLLRGYYQALLYLQTNTVEAHTLIARRMKLSADELQAAFARMRIPTRQDNLGWMTGSPSRFEQTRDRLHQLMAERGLLHPDGNGQLQADAHWLQQVTP